MSEAIAAREPRDRTWTQRLADPHGAVSARSAGPLAGIYYAGRQDGLRAGVLRPGGGDRLAARSASESPSSTSAACVYWPGVLIGDLLANNYSALPIGSALGQTVGNMLEVVLATVLLLRRLVRRGSPLDSIQESARSWWPSRRGPPSARRSA